MFQRVKQAENKMHPT